MRPGLDRTEFKVELATKTLARIFQQAWENKNARPWDDTCGKLLASEQNSLKSLGSEGRKKLETGMIEAWDVTFLSKLLLDLPGLIKDEHLLSLVKSLRILRNNFVHTILNKGKLGVDEFKLMWIQISDPLDELAAMVGSDWREQCARDRDDIASEAFDTVRAEQLARALDNVRAELSEVIGNVDDLREDQRKFNERPSHTATFTEVGRQVEQCLNEAFAKRGLGLTENEIVV